jgi:hypothetical protein
MSLHKLASDSQLASTVWSRAQTRIRTRQLSVYVLPIAVAALSCSGDQRFD